MRILVLDDDDSRHRVFRQNLIGHECVIHVTTVDKAIEAVEIGLRFDAMFLDHDLNDLGYKSLDFSATYGGPVELTGVSFCAWLVRQPDERLPDLVVIHSMNPVGADNMLAVLRARGIQTIKRVFDVTIGAQ